MLWAGWWRPEWARGKCNSRQRGEVLTWVALTTHDLSFHGLHVVITQIFIVVVCNVWTMHYCWYSEANFFILQKTLFPVYWCWLYRGADKPLAQSTSRCILIGGENISFDASLVIYINSTIFPPIMIINRIYEPQNLLLL